MTTALLFPGQGAQIVGMGKDLYAASVAARAVFDEANGVLGIDLAKACFEGPAETLERTDVCQPAILVMSIAALAAAHEKLGRSLEGKAAAGLSLGEYTALVAAGALSFRDAVGLVRLRGQAMQEACDAQPSTMATILGAERSLVEEACKRGSEHGVCVLANMLGPGQIAISGDTKAVEAACAAAKELGAKRAIPLKVAGAFHSPLMALAAARLREALAKVDIRDPQMDVVSNVTGRPARTAADVRDCLGRQVEASVLWEDSMRHLLGNGFRTFYEVGPGKVLSGIVRKLDANAKTVNVDSTASIAALA